MNTQVEIKKIDPAENCSVIPCSTYQDCYLPGKLQPSDFVITECKDRICRSFR